MVQAGRTGAGRGLHGARSAPVPMRAWTPDELAAFGDPDEIRISSLRPDGSARKPITIWIARLGDELYVRSAYGPDNGWYRRARASRSRSLMRSRHAR